MQDIWEIVIIILAGIGSTAFLAWYFFVSSKAKKHCSCSKGSCGLNKDKSLKDNNKSNRKV